jgi:phenylacetate-CoA ligase
VVYFAFGYGSFIGFWGAHYACEKMGALVIPGGAQTTEARIKQIVELGATTIFSTPTYALNLWQKARELGIDLAAVGAGLGREVRRYGGYDRDRHDHDL